MEAKMKEVYEDFYKIRGCHKNTCGLGAKEMMCDTLAEEFCFEPIECNDCLLETLGLSTAYAPYQPYEDIMTPQCSLYYGTVFAQLVKPHKKDMNMRQKGGCCK